MYTNTYTQTTAELLNINKKSTKPQGVSIPGSTVHTFRAYYDTVVGRNVKKQSFAETKKQENVKKVVMPFRLLLSPKGA